MESATLDLVITAAIMLIIGFGMGWGVQYHKRRITTELLDRKWAINVSALKDELLRSQGFRAH
ncbi:MAG: hypothetical protein EHM72_13525 [Calditrichaeota bacterium]|nr:MAG: hypothetical protein EHM72_13525 [Calditrichota bacterium]